MSISSSNPPLQGLRLRWEAASHLVSSQLSIQFNRLQGELASFLAGLDPVAFLLRLLGIALLAASGYLLTYDLFFRNLPLKKFATLSPTTAQRDFSYEGVAWFEGIELAPGTTVDFTYAIPRVLRFGKPTLDIFIDTQQSGPPPHSITLVVAGNSETAQSFRLGPQSQTTLHVPWQIPARPRGSLSCTCPDLPTTSVITVAPVVAKTGLMPAAQALAILGLLFIFVNPAIRRIRDLLRKPFLPPQPRHLILIVTLTLGYILHSGAFISNEFISGHLRVASSIPASRDLLSTSHLPQHYYRSTGFQLIPLATLLLEGKGACNPDFHSIYPTSRYLTFLLFSVAMSVLFSVLWKQYSRSLALLVLLGSFAHFPFIVDLYSPDSDSYFIFLFPLYLASYLYLINTPLRRLSVVFLLSLTLAMAAVKTQALILCPITTLGIALSLAGRKIPLTRCLAYASTLFIALLFSHSLGTQLDAAFQHRERNVGIPDQPFQRSVAWHILWGAYGLYDSWSAHRFTKSGPLRNKRVAERTGLPPVTYLRQSQIATDEVYRPDILRALKNRPGFFYSTAWLRAHTHGIKFLRHTWGSDYSCAPGKDLQKWFHYPLPAVADDNYVPPITEPQTLEARLIRFDLAWKISPLVFLAKLTQNDLTFGGDLILLIVAFAGILLFPNVALRMFLLGTALAQLAFSVFVHVPNRYFMFCDHALILGFCFCLLVIWRSLQFSACRTLPIH